MGRVYLYVGGIIVLGTIALVVAGVSSRLDGVLGLRPSGFIILAVLLFLSEARPMTILRLHEGSDITISWTFAFALVLLSPAGALFAMAGASAFGDAIRRKPLVRVAFNAAQMVVSLAVATCVLALPHGHDLFARSEPMLPWFGVMLCAASAAFFTNIMLTSVVLALQEGVGVYPMMSKAVASNLSTDGMLLALGPVFAITASWGIGLALSQLAVVPKGLQSAEAAAGRSGVLIFR